MNATTKPWNIIDKPNNHNMFMLGTTTLYVSHMPMFTMEDHHYQIILQVNLDPASMSIYLNNKAKNPDNIYNLVNLEQDKFTLPDIVSGRITTYPVEVYSNYSNEEAAPLGLIIPTATLTVERIVHFRSFNQNIPKPKNLTYLLYGDGKEAHLDHYIAADPDFQHLLTLPAVPTWLSTSQLQAGVMVTFAQPGDYIGCTPPLVAGEYPVLFQGIDTAKVSLKINKTVWYSTGNLLNAQDPCKKKVNNVRSQFEEATI